MSVRRTSAAILAVTLALTGCAEGPTSGGISPDETAPQFSSNGIVGWSGAPGSGLCSACHSNPNGDAPTVLLSGPTTVTPGATETYTFSMTPASGSDQTQGGLNAAAPSGTLISLSDQGTQLDGGEVTHTSPKAGTGTLSWDFQWTLPATSGTFTVYAAGLSGNGSGGTRDDETGNTSLDVTVVAANDAPVANDDAYATDEDVTLSTAAPGVLANDTDADGDPLTAVLDTDAANGSLTLESDGSFIYVPNADFQGADQFTYHVNDGTDDSNIATVDITVNAVNDAPTADPNGPYTGTVGEAVSFDGSGSTDIDGTIVSYEWDFGDGDTGSGVSPTHVYALADLPYTVSLTVTDDGGATDTQTTSATISDAANDAPVANDDAYATDEDVTLTVAAPGALANDTDADGDALTAVLDADVANGSLTLNGDGSFTYVPNANFEGADQFTYHANDGTDDSNIATVDITVSSVNDAPTADPNGPYTGTVGEAVSFDGSGSTDIDGTIVSYEWDFGDGDTGSGVSPTHVYALADLPYTVSLTVTDDGGATDTQTTSATISDAAVGQFYFLPPMVPAPSATGDFDGSRSPVVDICEVGESTCASIATFDMTTGPGSETVRVVPEEEHYIVNWHTGDFGLDPATTYRIRVLLDDAELGHADVDVVSGGRELKNVETGEYVALKNGRTLPIKFRIEEGP